MSHQPGSTSVKKRSMKFRYCNVVSSSAYENYDSQVEDLIRIGKDFFDWYAYIFHKAEENSSDELDSHDHFHILYYTSSPLSPASILKRFSGVVPENMVEFTISGPGFARYLTHKNRPEKIQYKDEDVVSSDLDRYYNLIRNSRPDSLALWKDYKMLRSGGITPEEFIEKYRGDLASMPMYQRFSMYQKIYDACTYQLYCSSSLHRSKDGFIVERRPPFREEDFIKQYNKEVANGNTKAN